MPVQEKDNCHSPPENAAVRSRGILLIVFVGFEEIPSPVDKIVRTFASPLQWYPEMSLQVWVQIQQGLLYLNGYSFRNLSVTHGTAGSSFRPPCRQSQSPSLRRSSHYFDQFLARALREELWNNIKSQSTEEFKAWHQWLQRSITAKTSERRQGWRFRMSGSNANSQG